MSTSTASYREVQDSYGRTYRVGETPESLTGRPRWVYIVVPWVAMMLISTFEYGWGTAEGTLGQAYHWDLGRLSWLFTAWVIFEAGASFPTGWLREHGYLSARSAVTIGGVAVAVSFVSLTLSASPWVAFIGWTIIGGLGAGMIYSSCINMSSKWYPENKGLRTGFLNGGFAYGSVPFIYLLGATFHLSDFRMVLILLGVGLGLGLLICSRFFVDPPKNWWPPQVDPIKFREDAERRRELNVHKNPPSVRQWPIELSSRTPQLYLLWFNMFLILSVALFGIAYTVPAAKSLGWGIFAAVTAGAMFNLIDGIGRPFAGWISEYLGRKQAMRVAFGIMAVGSLILLWGYDAKSFALFLIGAALTGGAAGMQFPLFATITADYYGESVNAQNYGVVYAAKIPGGLAGGVLGATVITGLGYQGGFLISAGLAILAVLATFTHRQPTVGQYERIMARRKETSSQPAVAGAVTPPAAAG
ncbi:MAG TPA: OFA family MFS transporter [Pseudonocardiaceae bacterium]|nr:OFA family MFS transporter [Pseudonocardiaceae bacterium]